MSISISFLSLRRRRLTQAMSALLCFAQIGFSSMTANAQSDGPFARLVGTWRGSGKVLMTNGNSERIRCTATYSAASGELSLSQAMVCASDSYRVDVRSYIEANGPSVQGHWEESVQQAAGQLAGQISGGQFAGKILGSGFEAALLLVTAGSRQTITVTPAGGSISRIQIALSRGG